MIMEGVVGVFGVRLGLLRVGKDGSGVGKDGGGIQFLQRVVG